MKFPSTTVHSRSCFCSSVILGAFVQIPSVFTRGCRRGKGRSLWVCVHKGDVFSCKMGILSLKKLEKNFARLRAYSRHGQIRDYLEKPQEQRGESPAMGLAGEHISLNWCSECVGWEQGWRSRCLGSALSQAGDSRVMCCVVASQPLSSVLCPHLGPCPLPCCPIP